MDTPSAPIATGDLSPTIHWRRWEFDGTIGPELGAIATEAALFSRGTDFTAWHIKAGGKPGSSLMRRLWQGESGDEDYEGTTVWTLHDQAGTAVGAAIWEHGKAELNELLLSDREHRNGAQWKPRALARAQHIGRVCLFLKAPLRGRGIMDLLIELQLGPALEAAAKAVHAQGAFPFLRAGDATPLLLEKHCSVPMPGFIRGCLNETERLRGWAQRAGHEIDGFDHWKVDWMPITKPKPARAHKARVA